MTTAGNTRIILICNSSFAFPVMQELVFFQQLAVVAVQGNRPDIVENTQVLLSGTGIPVVELEPDKNAFVPELLRVMMEHKVNMGLVMTFGYMLPATVYDFPEKGFFNVHPGPLPAYRGVDPVFWQIVNREEQAGVSIHKLNNEFDAGPLVITQMIKMLTTDTHGLLNSKLATLAANMVRVLLKLAAYNLKIPSKPQPELTAYYSRQGAKEVTLNWQTMTADEIIALINACNPWNKGAVTKFNNKILRILEAEKYALPERLSKLPGTTTVLDDKNVIVSTINNEALKLQIVYLDEGFFNASRLIENGLNSGSCFV